jgi:hypothetical protein
MEQPVSNLRVDLTSTDASELQRLLISSGVLPDLEEQFRTYNIELDGRLAFNGTLNGALKSPIVSGHAELGSLIVNQRDLGSLTANISSTAAEMRVTEGRLAKANGGSAQFSLIVPSTGTDNISIDASLNRMDAGDLIAALPLTKQTRDQLGDTQGEVSGKLQIAGIPKAMNGTADLTFGQGRLGGQPLQGLTARATFAGSAVTVTSVDANFDAGHIAGSGRFDTETKAFELKATGDRVQLERLSAFSNRPNLPTLAGTARLNINASGFFNDISSYQINFDGESNDATVDGRSAGAVKLAGRTQNKQPTKTPLPRDRSGRTRTDYCPRDLSNEKSPATFESTFNNADLAQISKSFWRAAVSCRTMELMDGSAEREPRLSGPATEMISRKSCRRGPTGTSPPIP